MSLKPTTRKAHTATVADFDRTTSRWGPITMAITMVIALAAPAYALFFSGLDIKSEQLIAAFLVVAATFGILAVIEPVTYFPILGKPAMYQAFMIGNIANKLIPAAITAQAAIDAKPGTRRSEMAAVSAISGAVIIHVTSLVLFVGLFGTWVLSHLPDDIMQVLQTYIVPVVFGAVHVQVLAHLKQPRTAIISIVISVIVVFVLLPLIPGLGMYGTVIAVVASIAIAWAARKRDTKSADGGTADDDRN